MPRTGLTPEQIKAKAIETAEMKIRRYGFERVRLVDIAKELGVSHAALYSHFKDKPSLLDNVSERWLNLLDEKLERICKKKGSPRALILEWFTTLYQCKREKVLRDPELYKAFDMAAEQAKPFVVTHIHNLHRQLARLVARARKANEIGRGSIESITRLLFEATMAFHHPRLVADTIEQNRAALLKATVETLLKGLATRSDTRARKEK